MNKAIWIVSFMQKTGGGVSYTIEAPSDDMASMLKVIAEGQKLAGVEETVAPRTVQVSHVAVHASVI